MIYLDHAALTPVLPEALEVMLRASREAWGNPNSVHAAGRRARAALEQARIQVAEYLGCAPPEVVFTSSGSEALAQAIRRAAEAFAGPIVSNRLEHPAVLKALDALEASGREVRWLPLPGGTLALEQVARELADAGLVVFSALNHELGTAPPLARMMEWAPQAGFVVDAVQAASWMDLVPLMGPSTFVAISSQKLGGPPGAGALRLPRELAFTRRDRRTPLDGPGTPPWLAAVGLGEACRVLRGGREEASARARRLGEKLLSGMRTLCPELAHNSGEGWWGTILNVSFPEWEGLALTAALDLEGVCIARGAACQSTREVASPAVLSAWPQEKWRADAATRWSLGWASTEAEMSAALESLRRVLATRVICSEGA